MSTELATTRQKNDVVANLHIEVESQRAIQEVQAAYVMAKKFPRSEAASLVKIIDACKRKRLAEISSYSYPKGKTTVSGASIRLAEVLARAWGNLRYGFKVLGTNENESFVKAYCLDLESNIEKAIEFTVRHIRNTKSGSYKLTDERDIYEIVANMASRRVRNCILAIIPEDIAQEAEAQCDKTLVSANANIPLSELIKSMAVKFAEFNVTVEMIETRLGHRIDVTTHKELVDIGKIYTSLKDNFASVSDYFTQPKNAKQQEDAKLIKLFSRHDAKQLKEVRDIMNNWKPAPIAKDEQELIIDKLEGKDIDADLPRMLAEVTG